MRQIGIQKIFWDAFELTISTQANRLAKDIAECLVQDPAPLLSEIRNERVGVYLFEDAGLDDVDVLDMRCSHVGSIGKWKTPCMEPVLWSANPSKRTGACLQHSLQPEPKDPRDKEFVQWVHEGTMYYIAIDEETVWTVEGVICGRYSFKNKVVKFFDVS